MNTQPRNRFSGPRYIGIGILALAVLGALCAPTFAQQADEDDPIRQQVEAANAAARAGTDVDRDWDRNMRSAPGGNANPPESRRRVDGSDSHAAAEPHSNADAHRSGDASHQGESETEGDGRMVWRRGDHDRHHSHVEHNGSALVSVGSDSTLAAGERADAVVSIFGSSTSSGAVADAVVSVFGSTRVESGEVGEASVAVLGDNYVNAPVHGAVVAVLGDVTLGPDADIGKNVVVIGGRLIRDPAARIGDGVQQVMTMPVGMLQGLRAWLESCARYLRPLAFSEGIGWAWAIAITCLALYVFFALMFKDPLDRCVKTLQEHPGRTVITSLLAMLLTPVLYTILAITVIGLAFIPIATFGIFIATLFGKAVVLAWMGRGLLKLFDREERLTAAVAVLAGGAVVLLLYTVPVLGFLVFNILGFLAFGAVIYTLLLAAKERRANMPPPVAAQPVYATAGGPSIGPMPPPDTSTGFTAAGDPFTAQASANFTGAGDAGATMPPPPGAIPGVNEAITLPRAGFWIRMLALAIDTVIIGIVLSAVFHHMGQIHMVLLATYGAIMWKLKGTTIGGLVCNLKVVRLDGQPIDWSTSIVRALGCFLSTLILFLGFIWIAFDPNRQGWHDKIAGTVVVRSPQGVSLL